MENRLLTRDEKSMDFFICRFLHCFVYLSIGYFCYRCCKKEKTWPELKEDLILCFYLLISYELMILVLTRGSC